MKKLSFLIALTAITFLSYTQEPKRVELLPQKATVYLKSAEISSIKKIQLSQGKSKIEFTRLPFYLNPKSIRVTSPKGVTIYSVNHQHNFIANESKKSSELIKQREKLEQDIEKKQLEKKIINKRLSFLQENMKVNGSQTNLNVADLKAVDSYFTKEITEITYKQSVLDEDIKKLHKKINEINNQIVELNKEKNLNSSSIVVEAETKSAGSYPFTVSYVIENAGWFPSYDIRFQSANQPMQLAYYANIYQNSNINWKNIALTLSSSDPDLSNTLANLKTYYLDYGLQPPTYKDEMISKVEGHVFSAEDKIPLIGASVRIENSTIGATTDREGKYSINVPSGKNTLIFSYIGMEKQKRPINKNYINVWLIPSKTLLNEVVVTGYGIQKKALMTGSVPVKDKGFSANKSIRKEKNIDFQVNKEQYQTSIEFDIKKPYSVPSDNKTHKLKIETLSLPSDYTYLSIPKIKQSTYLNAYIKDWESLNLLDGAANIYYEGTYTGETILDLTSFSDTLTIPLGVDKDIVVKRTLLRQKSSTSFWGNKQTDKRSWKIIVKNNKSQSVRIKLKDQIPVSANESIEVEKYNIDGGKYDEKTGEISWDINLKAGKKVEKTISYEVKYPKGSYVIVE